MKLQMQLKHINQKRAADENGCPVVLLNLHVILHFDEVTKELDRPHDRPRIILLTLSFKTHNHSYCSLVIKIRAGKTSSVKHVTKNAKTARNTCDNNWTSFKTWRTSVTTVTLTLKTFGHLCLGLPSKFILTSFVKDKTNNPRWWRICLLPSSSSKQPSRPQSITTTLRSVMVDWLLWSLIDNLTRQLPPSLLNFMTWTKWPAFPWVSDRWFLDSFMFDRMNNSRCMSWCCDEKIVTE